MSKSASAVSTGFGFAIASAALFAIRPIFVKLVYVESVSPLTLISLRMLFSLPVYIVILLFLLRKPSNRQRLNAAVILRIIGIGLMGYYVASFLDLIGLQYVSAQLGRLILYIYPSFAVVLGAIAAKQAIRGQTIVSLLVCYSGVALIFGHELSSLGTSVAIGALYITASALTFAVYLVFGKTQIDRVGSQLFTCIALIAASTGIFIHYAISSQLSLPQATPRALWLIAAIALFCTVLPTFFTTAAMARIGADKTGIVSMIGPAFTSLFAVVILAESFTLFHALGIALSIIGLAILRRSER